jgi:hypothetical protein
MSSMSSWIRSRKNQGRTSLFSPPRRQTGFRPRLEALEQRWLPSNMVFTVNSVADDGPGTLREAIIAADGNTSGVNTIKFNIARDGSVQTINLLSPLPVASGDVIIDATSEIGYATSPLIVLNGSQAGSTDGLVIDASPLAGCFVRALCIQGFSGNGLDLTGPGHTSVSGCFLGTDASGTVAVPNGASGLAVFDSVNTIGGGLVQDRNLFSGNLASGLVIDGGSHNFVENNFIGTDVHGTNALPNQADGVFLLNGAKNNTIGTTSANGRNIISGNVGRGIEIDTAQSTGNIVQSNFIGTDVTGNVALGNTDVGILLGGSKGTTIGGAGVGAGNVIAASKFDGITISSGGGNVVQANLIGTNAAGAAGLGNGGSGVAVVASAKNTIGGTAPGAANVIANNAIDGVFVQQGTSNDIQQNSIFGNANLGIELVLGGNHQAPAPKLTSAVTNGSSITVQGTLTSKANFSFTLEFFANPVDGPQHHAQGQTFLGSTTVVTDGTGHASFTTTLNASVPAGQFITATATASTNDTSAFSLSVRATAGAAAPVLQGSLSVKTSEPQRPATPVPMVAFAGTPDQAGSSVVPDMGDLPSTGKSAPTVGDVSLLVLDPRLNSNDEFPSS